MYEKKGCDRVGRGRRREAIAELLKVIIFLTFNRKTGQLLIDRVLVMPNYINPKYFSYKNVNATLMYNHSQSKKLKFVYYVLMSFCYQSI